VVVPTIKLVAAYGLDTVDVNQSLR
jgi:hypothetical protein